MIQSTTGLIHTLTAVCALVIGIVIFARPKATFLHRTLGYVCSISMAVMLVTAFFIYHLTKSFNLLHFLAIVSCPPLCLGFAAAFNRRRGWLPQHYKWMCFSYMGLCAAFIAEATTRIVIPYLASHYQIRSMTWLWAIVAVSAFGIFYAGVLLMERNKSLVAKFQEDQTA